MFLNNGLAALFLINPAHTRVVIQSFQCRNCSKNKGWDLKFVIVCDFISNATNFTNLNKFFFSYFYFLKCHSPNLWALKECNLLKTIKNFFSYFCFSKYHSPNLWALKVFNFLKRLKFFSFQILVLEFYFWFKNSK